MLLLIAVTQIQFAYLAVAEADTDQVIAVGSFERG
jgi:hypothetical protein